MIYKQIAVDPWQKFAEPITVVQYEGGSRTIKIQLNSGGLPIDLTAASVVFYAKKPDGLVIYNDCEIIDAAKGLAEYTLTTQMCAAQGELKCWVEAIKTDAVLRTQEFEIKVQAAEDSTGAIESTSEFTALEAALATVSAYDTRITAVETQAGENTDAITAALALVNAVVPIGITVDWPLPTLPNDRFIWARGQLVNRVDYPELWTVVQSAAVDESVWSASRQCAYSVGDGSTTFRVPDRRKRVMAGYAEGDANFGTLGKTLGAETHNNPLSNAGHAQIAIHNVSSNNIQVNRITVPSYNTTHQLTATSPGSSGGAAVTFGAALGGQTDAASNIQPTGVTNFAIRAK